MIPQPVVDGRRVERLVQELQRYAPHYTPDLNVSDEQSAGVALMRIFAQLAEAVLVRMGRTPHKHFVAFLDSLGINLLPARPARAAVTFRLATGLEESVRVPPGTRVTATGTGGDIVFETAGEVVAIPGALTAAYGVDPAGDVIVQPPPGFLAQEIRTSTELFYTVQSFAAAGSNRLQLDHVIELMPASLIRIGRKEALVVQKVADGNIITLAAPLDEDVADGTVATPVRDFEVFDGINRQEHVLYLGAADLFTIKEQVQITVLVELFDEQAAGAQRFDIAWQFWTKLEGDSLDNEEHWHDLEVTSDGTAGLNESGSIVLVKPVDLEIKEREINGRNSRWIRAALRAKLLADGGALPQIDAIRISVKSEPPANVPGIPADQGFHNATPLDLQVEPDVGFFPFGPEPRQFDQFYIASKEAFSKRDAEVTLSFTLDLQTLAAPSVVRSDAGLRAYSIGLRRRLYELDIASGDWQLFGSPSTDHPQGAGYLPSEDSAPSAITDATGGDLIYAFVKTEDTAEADPVKRSNKLWVHFHRSNGTSKAWVDLDAPATGTGKRLKFNPAAVVMPTGSTAFARVFVIGGDDKLYSRDISSTPAPVPDDWQLHEPPSGHPSRSAQPWVSSPFVTVIGSTILVFVTGTDGVVHRLTINGTSVWAPLTPSNQSFTAVSRPFAQAFGAAEAKVFVLGTTIADEWRLFECDTRDKTADQFAWTDLGRPLTTDGISPEAAANAPVGYIENADLDIDEENKHIFLRGGNNRLYERLDEEITSGTNGWEDRARPGDPVLRDAPAAHVDVGSPLTVIHVVAASGRNSLVTWDFEIVRAVGADPLGQAVQLDEGEASDANGHYVGADLEIIAGTGSPQAETIIAYDGALRLARLDDALVPPPDSSSECVIGPENLGNARTGADRLLALHDPVTDTRLSRPLHLRIDDDFLDLDFYSRMTGVVSLSGAAPGAPMNYSLYLELIGVRTEYLSVEDTSTVPELSWEYWNGRGWVSLTLKADGTRNFLTDGNVIFTVPKSIESTEVAGQENFWIRARLVGGDYGRETFKIVKGTVSDTVVSEKSSLRPPKVRALSIVYKAPPIPPNICLTFNNLDYLDQTAASQIGGAHFRPFEPLEDRSLTLFFGFDKPFKSGPVRLLLDAAEREFDESRPPELDWRFRRDRQWKKLDADDGSVALTHSGILTLSASEDLTRETRFGESLFWIKGSLRTDLGSSRADYPLPLLRGVFLNTTSAIQGETITEEIVGSSDGEPNQTPALQHADVLEGEDIRVREALSAEERAQIEREGGNDSVIDREDIGGTWVRWRETAAFFDAGPRDRYYLIDRAVGRLQFGDGVHGSIPPAGVDNIRAFSYRTGGGAAGNVAAGKIEALATAVAGIESVFNPTPAGGGSDKADTEAMLTIGPRRISHRDRAVSAEDFEELALEASRQVAKVRCLASTNLARSGVGKADPCDPAQRHQAIRELGWVSLIVVPDSPDPRPCPSLELRRAVKDYLRQRAPSVLADGERIVVRPPDYVEVAIEAEIVVASLEKAASAETQARTKLDALLHPLRGGPDGTGWDFGRPIWKSDVFAVLEQIEEVDRVENLRFHFRGGTDPERVVIGPHELLATGQHRLSVREA